jgi:molybdopterin synthase catalytic subunit
MSRLVSGVHSKGTVTLTDVVRKAWQTKDFTRTGAVTVFIGTVRDHTGRRPVERLELQAYEDQADRTLQAICRALKRRKGITDVQIHHLLGAFAPGDELVYVLVAGTHRHFVLPVLQEAVERYKTEAPIFKKEYTRDRTGKTRAVWTSEQGVRRKPKGRATL